MAACEDQVAPASNGSRPPDVSGPSADEAPDGVLLFEGSVIMGAKKVDEMPKPSPRDDDTPRYTAR